MGTVFNQAGTARLERSCGPSPRDWLKFAPSQPGIERIEAYFAGHAYDPHRHDTYAIGYTLGGVQCFDYRGARADSTAGNVIAIHPDERHDGRAGASAGFHYRMIYIEPRLIRDALGDRASSLPFLREVVASDPRLLAALEQALGDLDRRWEPLETDQLILGIADALLARDKSVRRGSASTICFLAVERARRFIEDNLTRTVASSELEAITGLDRYALARQFRARLGTSPHRYLTMRRLDRARAALAAGGSLAEAALMNGFADQSHMTRQFKQAYGISPGRWRALRIER